MMTATVDGGFWGEDKEQISTREKVPLSEKMIGTENTLS